MLCLHSRWFQVSAIRARSPKCSISSRVNVGMRLTIRVVCDTNEPFSVTFRTPEIPLLPARRPSRPSSDGFGQHSPIGRPTAASALCHTLSAQRSPVGQPSNSRTDNHFRHQPLGADSTAAIPTASVSIPEHAPIETIQPSRGTSPYRDHGNSRNRHPAGSIRLCCTPPGKRTPPLDRCPSQRPPISENNHRPNRTISSPTPSQREQSPGKPRGLLTHGHTTRTITG